MAARKDTSDIDDEGAFYILDRNNQKDPGPPRDGAIPGPVKDAPSTTIA
jgi:hypothetical protein